MHSPMWLPSTHHPLQPMADTVDQWSAAGLKNIFGNQVKVVEMESEAGAAGAVHGSLGTGAITTTFTASQGLLLMIPTCTRSQLTQLPCVFDVFRPYRCYPVPEHLR